MKSKERCGVDVLHKTISRLENENHLLKNNADYLKQETWDFEKKEQILVENCVKELCMKF